MFFSSCGGRGPPQKGYYCVQHITSYFGSTRTDMSLHKAECEFVIIFNAQQNECNGYF